MADTGKNNKTVLVSPLNWGLGHATRIIPLIKILMQNNYKVILAGEGKSGELLKAEFPGIPYVEIKSFNIKYSENKYLIFKIITQIPKIILGIYKEHKQLKKTVKKFNINIVISDNRYGLYSNNVYSVFITHQIFIQLPQRLKIFKKIITRIHLKRIKKFNICLIPDYLGETNLSGKLSHPPPDKNFKYIGILSDLKLPGQKNISYKYDIIFIISGPEPQRTIFENIILNQIKNYEGKILIVSGKPDTGFKLYDKKITRINHLSRRKMSEAIIQSKNIVSRAGYTTVMDLIKLKRKAVLIPVPGQTEQEYLADYLKDKKLFVFCEQNKFNLKKALSSVKKLNPDYEIFKNTQQDNFINIIKSIL
ncbi:MAG: glycosyltransferase [Chlorobi bacterium]|nr:glycosyltransferase [Chlorobiota bacterium]